VPSTWGKPDEEGEFDDPKLGRVRLQRWNTLHFEQAPKRVITRFRLERLEARGTRRDPQVVWLGYCGEELPCNKAGGARRPAEHQDRHQPPLVRKVMP
jgi:hypothetical protein